MLLGSFFGHSSQYLARYASVLAAVHALLEWCAAFGALKQVVSDGPTQFRNDALHVLFEGLQTSHPYMSTYFLLSNKVMKQQEKEIIYIKHTVLSELQ